MLFLLVWANVFSLISEVPEAQSSFQDLGKLLLGGVIAAIVVAIAFTFVRLKLRDKRPQASSFTSIAAKPDQE